MDVCMYIFTYPQPKITPSVYKMLQCNNPYPLYNCTALFCGNKCAFRYALYFIFDPFLLLLFRFDFAFRFSLFVFVFVCVFSVYCSAHGHEYSVTIQCFVRQIWFVRFHNKISAAPLSVSYGEVRERAQKSNA